MKRNDLTKRRNKILWGLKWLGLCVAGWFIWALLDSIVKSKNLVNSLLHEVPSIIWNFRVPDFILALSLFIIIIVLIIFRGRFDGLTIEKFKEMLADNQRMQKHNEMLIEQMNSFYKNYEELSKKDRDILDRINPVVERLAQTHITTEQNAIWIRDKTDSKREGPFCIRCFSADKKLIPMLSSKTVYRCPECKLDVHKGSEELSDEHIFILETIATQANRASSQAHLERLYEQKYGKGRLNFNLVLNMLSENHYISEIEYGEMEEIGYEIQPEGMSYLSGMKKTK
jgi:hypothetical protein